MIRVLAPTVLAWALMVILPGPNFVMTTQQATSRSRRAGLLSALGVSTGAAVWATSALLGLGALLAASSGVLRISRLIGGIVLLWFGARLIWVSRTSLDSAVERPMRPDTGTTRGAFRRGVLTSLSNPKAAVFFGSLFVASLPTNVAVVHQVALVGAVFAVSTIWYSCVALIMSTGPIRGFYERSSRAIDRFAGALLIALGLRLVISESN